MVNTSNITLSGDVLIYYGVLNFSINGKSQVLTGTSWKEPVSLSEGENNFKFLIIDRNGNVVDTSLAIFYSPTAEDNTGPVIGVAQYTDSTVVSNSELPLNLSFSDPSGISFVTINQVTATLEGNTWSQIVNLNEGLNQIIIKAVDNNNNETLDTLFIIFDATVQDIIPPSL